ncbi:hypothetical protein HFO15_01170 [Rhizobium laguerreae]|uniref:hypothetical protein n=1 Tax=Rhizobium laguerreae TaxID=1076926 RepID=UPI001C91E5C9|nr:hypothetical protein [Rhizobium laguerreae]MBY3260283.1 hypothetical protein [Rhizobium laguerreae]MBY3335590.1 hypothetical protein [Rhizobium laguerreae]
MNRKVVDSNAMQTDLLRSYLSASERNYAVLNDYAAMEAYKGNTLTSIYCSMEIACEFPRQMIVLKPTGRICALLGRNQGLQRRMIDERQTREFPTFCKRLQAARHGHAYFQEQLLESGRVANDQMDRILASAPILPGAIKELRKTFSPELLKAIRLDEPFPQALIEKSMKFIIDLTFYTISNHPSPPARIRSVDELQNTFLFRHSVATFVWSLDWIARGGADGVRPDRMRNDVVDVIFATYATFFDGLISNDQKAQRIYRDAQFILMMLSHAKVSSLSG